MKGLFNTKKVPKKQTAGDSSESLHSAHQQEKIQPQIPRSEPTSPVKPSSSSSRSPTKKASTRPASPAQREQPKSRSSRSFARHSTDQGSSSSRRSKIDPNTHPLNLPPDEIKRLSAQYSMNNRSSLDKMDVDKDTPSAPPSSPPPVQPQASFTVPVNTPTTNGVKNDADEEAEGPAPPPHRSNPSSPVPTDAEAAEAHKADGNRFFKQKDYARAIAEYTSAIQLMPDEPTYLSNRAAAFMSDGQYEAALEDCQRAVDLDPHNPKYLLRLARIYTSLGRPEEAITTFGRIHPPPSAKDMATAKEMLHHVKAAQDALDRGTSGSMVLHALDQAEKLLGPGASKPRKWQLMRGYAYLKMGVRIQKPWCYAAVHYMPREKTTRPSSISERH
ncbi:hypothetical protein M434DRAFT_179491 [Hypoxylon sp. CO27-5]|nr:hypothetical protein M434DRAFT_179491 [Hypoxylon sp. CO27-5]